MPSDPDPDLLDLVANIVSAHVTHNAVTPEALPGLIRSVYATLNNLGNEAPAPEQPEPAVPIKKSVFPDHIVCLEDGKKLEMLKRHLRTSHGMTPEEYRARWSLSRDYPMVAPKYAARRCALAKEIGLGRKGDPSKAQSSPPIRRVAEACGVSVLGERRAARNTSPGRCDIVRWQVPHDGSHSSCIPESESAVFTTKIIFPSLEKR